MTPEVSIYITNYNYGKYIAKAIDSCLNQTFENIEILIIDDGSTDTSKKIINYYASKYSNVRSQFHVNQGLIKSCNAALKGARGKYILRLDADDWLDKNAIEIMHSKLEKNKKIELIFPDYYEVDESGNILHIIRRHDFNSIKLFDVPAHGACSMLRTNTLIINGGYDENFGCQDGLDIWLRFYKKFKVMNLNIPLFFYRRHGLSLSENKAKILENRNKILFKHNLKRKKIVAFVPIRGEHYDRFSQVFKQLGKKKLIDWTLQNLLKTRNVDYIIISSPDKKVLNYVKKLKNRKFITLQRDISLATQSVALNDSIIDGIKKIRKLKKYNPDYVLLSKLNCPFRNHKHLENALNTIQIFNLDMVYGVLSHSSSYFKHNGNTLEPLRYYDYTKISLEDNKRVSIKVEGEEIYIESGNFVIYNKKSINMNNKKHFKIGHEILDSLSAFEIKNNFDWLIAESIAQRYKKFLTI